MLFPAPDTSAAESLHKRASVLLFSKLNIIFFGYFDQDFFYFIIMKTKKIRGDLTDALAKKGTLACMPCHHSTQKAFKT